MNDTNDLLKISCGIAAVRLRIGNAVLLPPMLEPPPAEIGSEISVDTNVPRHLRHLAPRFVEALPIGFCGIAEATPAKGIPPYSIEAQLYLYHDCNGLRRAFNIFGHDRTGIASLFAGDERLLAGLWPARRGRWDAGVAAETLFCQQGRVGIVRGYGFALLAEPSELQRAHLALSRLTRRLLRRGVDPYRVLGLSHGWNATRGQGALSDDAVVQIVDAACAHELRIEDRCCAG